MIIAIFIQKNLKRLLGLVQFVAVYTTEPLINTNCVFHPQKNIKDEKLFLLGFNDMGH